MFISVFMMLLLTSCGEKKKTESAMFNTALQLLLSGSVPVITVDKLVDKKPDVLLIDVREREEYQVSRIPDALHAGYKKFNPDNFKDIRKEQEIIVYCSVGYRSEKAGEKLQEAGFENVRNLYGGIIEWVNRQNPLENDDGLTNKLHPYGPLWRGWITNENLNLVYSKN